MQRPTALVVDDSRSARFALRRILEARGYAVDTAESAEDALAYLARQRPALVFLDYTMPGMDGFELLDRLAGHPETAGVPVVLCSSNDSEDFARQARAHGAIAVLSKPPDAEGLTRVLSTLAQGDAEAPPRPPAEAATPSPEPAPPPGEVAAQQSGPALDEIVARLAALESRVAALPDEDAVRRIARQACEEALATVRAQLGSLEARLSAADTEVPERLLQQAQEAARQAATAAAEQAVTSASARIAERIADALVRAAGDGAG